MKLIKPSYEMIIEGGHESVLEHQSLSVKFTCDRGVSHELVRHRLCSFSQESTRYCNYSKDKFDNQLSFIVPCWLDLEPVDNFKPYPKGVKVFFDELNAKDI